jgi:hypothetical protein
VLLLVAAPPPPALEGTTVGDTALAPTLVEPALPLAVFARAPALPVTGRGLPAPMPLAPLTIAPPPLAAELSAERCAFASA